MGGSPSRWRARSGGAFGVDCVRSTTPSPGEEEGEWSVGGETGGERLFRERWTSAFLPHEFR